MVRDQRRGDCVGTTKGVKGIGGGGGGGGGGRGGGEERNIVRDRERQSEQVEIHWSTRGKETEDGKPVTWPKENKNASSQPATDRESERGERMIMLGVCWTRERKEKGQQGIIKSAGRRGEGGIVLRSGRECRASEGVRRYRASPGTEGTGCRAREEHTMRCGAEFGRGREMVSANGRQVKEEKPVVAKRGGEGGDGGGGGGDGG